MKTAIATPDNEKERQAVQNVAAQRKILVDHSSSRTVKQKVTYTAWEHHDFAFQPPGALDHFCGPGFYKMYSSMQSRNNDTTVQDILEDFMLICLLKSGSANGYVKRNVTLASGLTRGIQGVAVKYLHQNRIHSSILLLPLLSSTTQQGGVRPTITRPSTVLPVEAMKYLLSDDISSRVTKLESQQEDVKAHVQKWQEFLYHIIRNESSSWVLLNAACSDSEREELQTQQKLIATTCQFGDECCSIYDPTRKPFVAVRRQTDDDDDDDK